MSTDVAVATLSAYKRWASVYPPYAHSPLMRAEERAMLALRPDVADKQVLDLACGSGRYTRQLEMGGPRRVVSMDFCLPMLVQVAARQRVCADMMHLPFADACFDVVISGLAVGHATSVEGWMSEVARVLKPGGTLLYSDFHPDAAAAGHQRSFRDADNEVHTVPHACYDVEAQRAALRQAGLRLERLHEVRVGIDLHEQSERLQQFYARWHGLAVVLVVRAAKPVT
jgi:ubiquinone/menaquinone biosynthesis C-methylase UbiE